MIEKFKNLILLFILFLALVLRLHKLAAPLADWHSWRQADTSAVGRHYLNYGINLLEPKYDDLSDIPSGQDNPQGYRMVELPIYSVLQVCAHEIYPFVSFEAAGRLVSIFFSLWTIVFLYLIVSLISGWRLGLLSSFVYAVLPYNIFYNRTILPETMMVGMSVAAIYLYAYGIQKAQSAKLLAQSYKSKLKIAIFIFLSLVCFSLALLLKPFAVFLIMPPVLYVTFARFLKDKKIYFFIVLLLYCLIGLIPFILWRLWIQQFPEGIPANMWLLNGDSIRFKGAWFYWLFAERISKLILGYWGGFFLVLGLIISKGKSWFYWLWFLGSILYLVVVATGNVRHDYYQILITPVLSVLVARGMLFLYRQSGRIFNKWVGYLTLGMVFIFMEAFGWYQIRDYFNINHPEIVQSGQALAQISQPQDLVIAPYGGDTAFLYQTHHRGWPIGGNIPDKISKGAVWYVSVSDDEETNRLIDQCGIIDQGEGYLIVNLKECRL